MLDAVAELGEDGVGDVERVLRHEVDTDTLRAHETHDEFELRRYPEHLVAEISVTAPFEEAGSRAFRALAGYINGANDSRSTVAMTAPVVQQAGSVRVAMTAPVLQSEGQSDDYVIAFVLPSGMTAATVPVPTDPDVRTRVVPVQVAAARRFSGRGSEGAFARHLRELESALASAGLAALRAVRRPLRSRTPPAQRGRHRDRGLTPGCGRMIP